ncbi:helix-turn-helix domain-containing protein [Paenibacillus ehimensis]|uniref:helix-turn-helix domain-containing protein n=1 Tax=Paenibacillus ehimensis TaxID=79264 RepID=UPI002BA28CDF|nr:helix-turn-helix domain-containing protein [Paenibacillus ehimensis]MEC0208638.1 helix-turn-helix domain-containing protein [Paenibacillus ehimensis]HWO95594.1 helix-turn-helix domain-containing protein [Bacillus sp. (in: firmicutes)]
MNNPKTDLFDLVHFAQAGDKKAMLSLVERFTPLIRKSCRSVKQQDRQDIEQQILEKIIIAMKNYNLEEVPDYLAFCEKYCK